MKLAIVVGHTEESQGAIAYNGVTEYEYNYDVAALLSANLKCENKIFYRDDGGIAGAYKRAGEWGAEASIELHFNAFSQKAWGGEILIIPSDDIALEIIANKIISSVCSDLGISLRGEDGIRKLSRKWSWTKLKWIKDSGYYNLETASNNGIRYPMLIEPAFCNIEQKESKKIMEDMTSYVESLVNILDYYFYEKLEKVTAVEMMVILCSLPAKTINDYLDLYEKIKLLARWMMGDNVTYEEISEMMKEEGYELDG